MRRAKSSVSGGGIISIHPGGTCTARLEHKLLHPFYFNPLEALKVMLCCLMPKKLRWTKWLIGSDAKLWTIRAIRAGMDGADGVHGENQRRCRHEDDASSCANESSPSLHRLTKIAPEGRLKWFPCFTFEGSGLARVNGRRASTLWIMTEPPMDFCSLKTTLCYGKRFAGNAWELFLLENAGDLECVLYNN